jgi:hypothetical protein
MGYILKDANDNIWIVFRGTLDVYDIKHDSELNQI